ncbi:MAG TPA: gamma-glutamylcyclotransferase [Aestuariivirgaceae bacterium]|jgi:cation transport protein ChaC|nr:gamma-glutamylcyclotransferase [Aestuariivirgaceae bacterium]
MTEHWVFAYGSLMWRPDIPYVERRQALLHGHHRRLCIYSYVHRGSREKPGLVMGLDRGGACRGIAYRIEAAQWPATLDYLRAREQVTAVYVESQRPLRLLDGDRRMVSALVYEADRRHPQYAGRLSFEEQVRHVLQGVGVSGRCIDYVDQTVAHLREMGIRDGALEALGKAVSSEIVSSE